MYGIEFLEKKNNNQKHFHSLKNVWYIFVHSRMCLRICVFIHVYLFNSVCLCFDVCTCVSMCSVKLRRTCAVASPFSIWDPRPVQQVWPEDRLLLFFFKPLSSSLSCYLVLRQISFTYPSRSSPCSLRVRPQGRLLRASAEIACPTATNLSGPWFKGVKLGFPIFEKRINLPQPSPTYSISVTPHIRNETSLAIAGDVGFILLL